jgi:ribosomal protein S30
MLLSVRLDKDGKVWKHPPKLSDKQMDELIEEVKKQKFIKKRKLHE